MKAYISGDGGGCGAPIGRAFQFRIDARQDFVPVQRPVAELRVEGLPGALSETLLRDDEERRQGRQS